MTAKPLSNLFALVAAVLAMAFSQTSVLAAENTIEEITVLAPRITSEDRRSPPYGKTIVAEKSMVVNISDLDITRTADFRKVRDRVEEAATSVCEQLEDELPFGQPSTPECIRRAVSDAMAQVDEIAETLE